MSYNEGKNWARIILGILDYNNWRKWCTRNAMFYPKNIYLWPINFIAKWEKCLCDPVDGNKSITKHLHLFSCQNVQIPCIWVCRLFHISNHVYANNSFKILNIQCSIECSMWAQRSSLNEHKKIFNFVQNNILNVHAQFIFPWQLMIGVNTLTWAPKTTKHDHFPLWSIFTHSTRCTANVPIHISWRINLSINR